MLPSGSSFLLTALLVLALDVEQLQAGDKDGAVDAGAALQAPQLYAISREASSLKLFSAQ